MVAGRVAEASIWTSARVALSAADVVGTRACAGRVNNNRYLTETLESNTVEINHLLPTDAVANV